MDDLGAWVINAFMKIMITVNVMITSPKPKDWKGNIFYSILSHSGLGEG